MKVNEYQVEAAHAATDVGLDEEYTRYSSKDWIFMMFQIAVVVLSVCVLFLNWEYLEVPCMR